jgi:hypothetical protein
MIQHMQGETPECFTNKQEGLAWVERITDMWVFITEFLKGRMGINEYMNSMRVKKESATWSKTDPWPTIFYVLLTPYLIFKR